MNLTSPQKYFSPFYNLGLRKWKREYQQQLHTLNEKGPSLMKEDIRNRFMPVNQKSFEEYINGMSNDADQAFKKTFVAYDNPFQDIAKVVRF